MMKLESIVPGSRLAGVHGVSPVEVVATRAYGTDAVEVTWKGPEGLGERILYRDDEPRLREVSPGRRYAFDGDGHDFPGVAGARGNRDAAGSKAAVSATVQRTAGTLRFDIHWPAVHIQASQN